MQAVIMAAGRGARMGILTDTLPKVMLEVAGKTLLEHKFDALPPEVDEIILIVGYMGSSIQKKFGGEYNGKKIVYVEQDTLDGTAGALWRGKGLLHDRFLVLNGDDIYGAEDIARCIATPDWAMGVSAQEHIRTSGSVQVDSEGRIVNIVENHENGGASGLVGTNLFVFDTRLFSQPMIPKAPGSSELGLPQTAIAAAKALNIPFYAVPATFWLQITGAEDLEKAQKILQNNAD
ncbi:NTP transferase domain-containing protein [Candidatus Kaiserbacteria bacterium]|nr:NTP transferase domain-containing protein [Candidatus Kaiserbacteria bacterium]